MKKKKSFTHPSNFSSLIIKYQFLSINNTKLILNKFEMKTNLKKKNEN
jgi:hypothetical protein